MDNRNNPKWEEHKNQGTQEKGSVGSKEDINSLKPGDHLKDGTNDLENGDQEPTSASGSKPSSNNERSSSQGS